MPLVKGMSLSLLSTAMDKIVGQTDLANHHWATSLGEGKTLNTKSHLFSTGKNYDTSMLHFF